MIRWLLTVILLAPLAAYAQGEPRLDVELPEGEVVVGQPLTLRLKLLVPSWMPKPPVWPTLEVPSLLVRLPERASTPVSETIEGETWSGISRAYRLYPLEVGRYEIPAQTLVVTYADPGKPDPIIAELTLEPVLISAVLPKEAKGLNPPIVASGLMLEQQIDGGPDLTTGDAMTRTVTITIMGTTPILLPALMPALATETGAGPAPLRAYPKEPVVTETEQRGVLSGTRTETTTYVAQSGGDTALAPISLNWFNLDSGKVETIELAGTALHVTAPPPPPPGLVDYARWAALSIAFLVMIWGFVRLIQPRLLGFWRKARTTWRQSERYAHRAVVRALGARDLNAVMAALDRWAGFYPSTGAQDFDKLNDKLAQIGAARFGKEITEDDRLAWDNFARAYYNLRANARAVLKAQRLGGILPDLNP